VRGRVDCVQATGLLQELIDLPALAEQLSFQNEPCGFVIFFSLVST